MYTFAQFEQHLHEALAGLYDPAYRAPELFQAAMDRAQGMIRPRPASLQAAIITAIEALQPGPSIPSTARSKRIYDLLLCRYVQDLTQEGAAERLGITPRHLRREQQEAIGVLAQYLWENSRTASEAVTAPQSAATHVRADAAETTPDDWSQQVKQELASLQETAPNVGADVVKTIHGVISLGHALALRHDIGLETGVVQPDLYAAIHPSALRQVLITAIGQLVAHMVEGTIVVSAQRAGGSVAISVTGSPVQADVSLDNNLIGEILATQGGSLNVKAEAERFTFWVRLAVQEEITVLVVDDNLDLAHFYKRYTEGTRYRIVHILDSQRLSEMVRTERPSIIVLDIMLPEVDGWDLLTRLREDPTTRGIPVIVCSVVREAELALALGAALYLPKPVRRREFVEALDGVLSRVSTAPPKTPASNPTTY
jgi:CheY-like chemotaxis protein